MNEFSHFFLDLFNLINISTIAFALILQVHFLDLAVYSIFAASQDGASNSQQNFLPVFFRYWNSMSPERGYPELAKGFARPLIKREESEMLPIDLLFSFIPF